MSDLWNLGSPALLDLLPNDTQKALRDQANRVRYEDGQLIHERGDTKPGLSIVHSGKVKFGNPGSDGSYVTTALFGEGHCFGEFTLFANLPRTHDAIAVGNTVIDQIDATSIDRLLVSEPELYRLMLVAVTRRLHAAVDFMDDMRRLPLKVRIAKLILTMSKTSDTLGEIKLTQSDLAFSFGVSRVSIGQALSELQSENLIKTGYGNLHIPDSDRLALWVSERSSLLPV